MKADGEDSTLCLVFVLIVCVCGCVGGGGGWVATVGEVGGLHMTGGGGRGGSWASAGLSSQPPSLFGHLRLPH